MSFYAQALISDRHSPLNVLWRASMFASCQPGTFARRHTFKIADSITLTARVRGPPDAQPALSGMRPK